MAGAKWLLPFIFLVVLIICGFIGPHLLIYRWLILFLRERGKQCSWIAIRLPALLVEGIPQAPMNAEFHSAATRPIDAFSYTQRKSECSFFIIV